MGESGRLFAHAVCVCVYGGAVIKRKPSLYTWDKHNGGNKSGQCCLVLS